MKLIKMSLATAVLLGASAYAIDNIKVNGDAKAFYSTDNTDKAVGTANDTGLFGQANSVADTALRIGVKGDLTSNVSFGVTGYAVSTLGLENNLVSGTWAGSRNGVKDGSWMGEAWIAGTAGKTTGKVGRMELDTPLIFSEKWSTVPNTFTGAVLINQDIPDTQLIGAWVGQGNGLNFTTENNNSAGWDYMGKEFGTFGKSGAYTVGAINNSFKPLVAQAWYYNMGDVVDAYWLQADIDCSLVPGVKIGVQYANMDPKATYTATTKDSTAYAVKLAYEGVKDLTLAAAYSSADKDNGGLMIGNLGTYNNKGVKSYSGKFLAQSKLYTEAWWNFGYVGTAGADTVMLSAAYDAGFAKLFAQYTDINVQATGSAKTNVTEATVTATKSFGPLDATLAYIMTNADDQNSEVRTGRSYDTVQAYLTLNF